MHHVPLQIGVLPTVMMVIGFVIAWHFYIRRPDIPVELARQHDVLYRFLLNKWYFDELYEVIFVRPTKWLGRLLWKSGDGWLIDGFGPDGVSARVLDVTRNVVRLQTGYLYHYAFAMLIGAARLHHLVHVRGGATDDELADPLRRHLPAAGRRGAYHAADARRRASRRAATRAGWRCGPRSSPSRSRWSWSGASMQLGGIPVRRETSWLGIASLSYGRRRHFAAVRHPHDRSDAALHPR